LNTIFSIRISLDTRGGYIPPTYREYQIGGYQGTFCTNQLKTIVIQPLEILKRNYQLNDMNTPNNSKEATYYYEILSNLAIFVTLSANNRGSNPRIQNFVHKMKNSKSKN